MSLLSDKAAEVLVAASITGLVSAVVWLFKAIDRLDLECHDLRRDVAHLQRTQLGHSANAIEEDKELEVERKTYNRYFAAIERRFNRLEMRLNSLFSRRSSDIKIEPD